LKEWLSSLAACSFSGSLKAPFPLLPMSYKKTKSRHAVVNLSFTVIHLIIHTFLPLLLSLLSDWCSNNRLGLVYWLHVNAIGVMLIILEFSFICGWLRTRRRASRSGLFWRFHLVHHADNNVDVTTGLRHHPIESVLRGIFFIFWEFFSGLRSIAVMIYQTLGCYQHAFTHANISLPKLAG
jgi:sterol desaturase/sphingolipid hydroxylase (fatty acid hydroxylase superfamily)